MSLKEKNLRAAILGALLNVVKDTNDAERKELLDSLLEQYRETGNKSFSVFLPSGDKVATVTLNESKPETVVTDQDALLEWCRTNRPDLVESVEHPPVEAWTETRLKGSVLAHLVEDYKLAGDTYLTDEGEPVAGVEHRLPGEPSKFTLSYVAKDRGLSLVEAWRTGQAGVELGPRLPQIGGGS